MQDIILEANYPPWREVLGSQEWNDPNHMSPEIGFTKKYFVSLIVNPVIGFIQMQSNEGINNFKNSSPHYQFKKVRNFAQCGNLSNILPIRFCLWDNFRGFWLFV